MRGISHAIIGSSLTYAVFQQLQRDYGIVPLAASLVGSVLADIDDDDSTINSYVPLHYKKIIYLIASCFLFYQVYRTRSFMLLLPAFVLFMIYISSHRGFTHSLFAMFIFSLPIVEYESTFIAFTFSYVLHLICDLINVKGEQLLWPMPVRYRLPVHFSMKSTMGKLIELSAILISAFLAIACM